MIEPSTGQLTHAFLFADLRGYTAFLERHGDAAGADLIDRYRALVRDIVASSAGAEIRTEGDSFYLVFPSASRAVSAGLAIVAAAAEASASDPTRPIAVGIGIHAGEAEARPDGYVGTAVNIAARVCALAQPGEVLVTDMVRGLIRSSGRFRFTARGRPQLKGIAEPIALFRVDAADAPGTAVTPVRVAGTRPTVGRLWLWSGLGAAAVVVFALVGLTALRGGGSVASSPPTAGTQIAGTSYSPAPPASSTATATPQGSGDATASVSACEAAPATGRIAFISSPTLDPLVGPIYVADTDGSHRRLLTPIGDTASEFALSPDRREVVYHSADDVKTVAIDDARPARSWPGAWRRLRLPTGGSLWPFTIWTWLPADRLLVRADADDQHSYELSTDGRLSLFGGSNARVEVYRGEDFAVSPDGQYLAFHSIEPLWISRIDGSSASSFDHGLYPLTKPAWSPDGQWIAFQGTEGRLRGPGRIWKIDPTWHAEKLLTEGNDDHPSWSPDGQWIAFSRPVVSARRIFAACADGSGVRQLPIDIPSQQLVDPVWLPAPR